MLSMLFFKHRFCLPVIRFSRPHVSVTEGFFEESHQSTVLVSDTFILRRGLFYTIVCRILFYLPISLLPGLFLETMDIILSSRWHFPDNQGNYFREERVMIHQTGLTLV